MLTRSGKNQGLIEEKIIVKKARKTQEVKKCRCETTLASCKGEVTEEVDLCLCGEDQGLFECGGCYSPVCGGCRYHCDFTGEDFCSKCLGYCSVCDVVATHGTIATDHCDCFIVEEEDRDPHENTNNGNANNSNGNTERD